MALLRGIRGSTSGREIDLEDQILVGRRPDCDVVLPHPAVSRRHAVIRRSGGQFCMQDLGSRNGTIVNGVPRQTCHLMDGDIVRICGFEFVFESAPPHYQASIDRQSQANSTKAHKS